MGDFTAVNHGSVIMLTPLSPVAQQWCLDNLPDDCLMMGDSIAIEPRYFSDIAEAILDEGMQVI